MRGHSDRGNDEPDRAFSHDCLLARGTHGIPDPQTFLVSAACRHILPPSSSHQPSVQSDYCSIVQHGFAAEPGAVSARWIMIRNADPR
jgi:hypothetical protein